MVKSWIIALGVFAVIIFTGSIFLFNKASKSSKEIISDQPTAQRNMQIKSEAFDNGMQIPANYTCDGPNVNPPLSFYDIPPESKSLAISVDDPDAPGGNFVHWLIWNIDPKTRDIKQDEVPQGSVQGKNGFGTEKYQGPCPPSGTHHYKFTLFALDTVIDLPHGSEEDQLLNILQGHILQEAVLTGTYLRQ